MEVRRFTDSAIREAELIRINKQFLKNRPVVSGFTIDGPASMDLDDGVFLSKSGNNYILEISISDVTSAIKLYSELFRIAYDRIETRYLTDYNIPMIPAMLSESKLSLLPGNLKPAITFYLEISSTGDVVNLEMKETAFNNLRKLSYRAFDIIARKDKEDAHHNLFAEMIHLAEFLINRRRNKGALAIYDLKKGIYTNEEGMILPLKKEFSHYGNLVVQEFSILTNKAVGWFFANNDIPILFRNHTTKQSTPDRKEILAQINTSIMHPQHLQALRQRSRLWFNKADYGPVVRGHFGLNEPVYTHVTSPIRRLADLINHYIIKSYINNIKSPLEFTQLESMAKDINSRKLEINKEKVEYFKEKADETSLSILSNYSEDELEYLKENEFSNVLNIAVKNDIVSEKLSSTLLNRFKSNKIDANILYIILFKSNKDSSEWLEFKKEALYYIEQTKGMATQLLHILKQKKIIKSYVVDQKKIDNYYSAKTVASFNDELLSTEKAALSIKKKDAINKSSFEFLKLLLNIQLPEEHINEDIAIDNENIENSNENLSEKSENKKVANKNEVDISAIEKLKEHLEQGVKFDTLNTNDENENISQSSTDKKDSEIEENYVGQLLEICTKNPKLSSPHYDFTVKGMSHAPIITCFATIVTPELTIERKAVSNSKKSAKQEASRKLLNVIGKKQLDVIVKREAESEPNNPHNYVGKLLELCIKSKLLPPDFSFNKMGDEHNPVFDCCLTINIFGKRKEFTAYAHSKKKSKQNASEKCYNYLKNNIGVE